MKIVCKDNWHPEVRSERVVCEKIESRRDADVIANALNEHYNPTGEGEDYFEVVPNAYIPYTFAT